MDQREDYYRHHHQGGDRLEQALRGKRRDIHWLRPAHGLKEDLGVVGRGFKPG